MLIDFSVRNFGPFRDTAVLSMQGTALVDSTDNLMDVNCVKGGVLTSAMVFGANASGKSYLVKALRALRSTVSQAYEEGFDYGWYEPFRLDRQCLSEPVDLGIRMVVDGIRYDYSVSYGYDTVVSESLRYYPKGRPRTVFERTGPEEYGPQAKKGIVKLTSPSSTYLAVAAKYNDDVCNTFRNALLKGIIIPEPDLRSLYTGSLDLVARDDGTDVLMADALRAADLGVASIEYDEDDIDGEVYLKHDFPGCDDDLALFPMSIESNGTMYMFGLAGYMVEALRRGATLVVDEFGSYLHPALTRWAVGRFATERNPNGAQLIVNTHDVNLMKDADGLRRDQVWFVNRDRSTGASSLYSLSDYKGVRQNSDILSAYMFGRFDAVPEPSDG